MEVELASHSGFCFGVKRAIRLAFQAADREKNVYCLGSLIHNPQVVDELKGRGVKVVEDLSHINEGTIIIRSHGAPPSVFDEAKRKGLKVVDATCPLVKRAQNLARQLHDEGYTVVIVGERDHYEVKALIDMVDHEVIILENPDEAGKLKLDGKVGLLSQTTQSMENFKAVIGELVNKAEELKIFNTICEATRMRQEATAELARRVDLMLVVGGYGSANTRRLAQISQNMGAETHHIEVAQEIDSNWLKGKERIGVTAGASTPGWIIEEVMNRLKAIS